MRILVVDDEREIADYILELVDEITMNQAESEVFYSGSKALKRIKETEFDLVISDIVMPVTDGLRILEYIAGFSKETEVIFLSAHKEFDYIYKANQLKPINYIVKTEDVKIIKKIMEQVIESIKARKKNQAHEVINSDQMYEERVFQAEADLMESVCKYVRNNMNSDLNITQIAEVFHYNASYLSRVFKNTKGCNLSSYIQEQKIHKAKQYLMESDFSVAKIANLVGYHSPQAFNRVFRKDVKVTPQSFRRYYKKGMGDETKV